MAGKSAVEDTKAPLADGRDLDDNELSDSAGEGTATPSDVINAEEPADVDTDQGKLRALLGILRKVIGVKVCRSPHALTRANCLLK